MFVSDILKSKGYETVSVVAADSLATALSLMAEKRIGAVLVKDGGGNLVGILSERDVVGAMHAFGTAVFDKTAGDLMTSPVVTCAPHDPVAGIMGMMTQRRFRHLPVVEGGKLIGIVSLGDVVKSRIDEAQSEVEALRNYISL